MAKKAGRKSAPKKKAGKKNAGEKNAPSKARPRTERRRAARQHDALIRNVRRLQALEPGASPEHPIVVDATSQIEPHARALRCSLCNHGLRIDDQRGYVHGGRVQRALSLHCPLCREEREIHFAVPAAN